MKKKFLAAFTAMVIAMLYSTPSLALCEFYTGNNFTGYRFELYTWDGFENLAWTSYMNDNISSIRLSGDSTKAIYYRDAGYKGTRWVKKSSGNIINGNNQASSLQCR